MEWLKDYEGGRGVAYLLALVGMVSPSVIALYVLAHTEFLAMDWAKLVLLSAAIGGLITGISVGSAVVEIIVALELDDIPSSKIITKKAMSGALVLGAISSLMVQVIALAIACLRESDFKEFLLIAFVITLFTIICTTVPGAVRLMARRIYKFFWK